MADKDSSQDDSTELKKRARRRLVGAIALALAAVVVLPMVMDSEPRPAGQDIQVRIPAQDGADSPSVPVSPSQKNIVPAVTASISGGPISADSGTGKPSAEAITTRSDPPSVKPAPESPAVAKSAADSVKATPEKSPVKPADKPAEKAETKKAEEARAVAALEGKSAPVTNGGYIVQLGAYQNAGNVKLLIAKLKEMGVPAYTEKLDSPQGARTRVRAGPFSSKEAAEKAQVKIRKIGVAGPVAPKQ